MTIADSCILVACLLPIACAVIAKSKGFDNRHPRQWAATLEGWRARANAAQLNGFEILPIFIAGVLIAERTRASAPVVDGLAVAFIVTRIAYIAVYLANQAALRSLLWGIGLACCIALFFVG